MLLLAILGVPSVLVTERRAFESLTTEASPLPHAAFPLPHHASTSPGSKGELGAPPTVQVDPAPHYDDALWPLVPKTTCKLRIISSCDKYTVAWLHSYADLLATRANSSLLPNGLWDTSNASSDPLNLPITVQAALINQQVVRHASDVRLTLVASPDADENGVALGGRLLA